MFSPMYLMIEKNKLKERFKGTVASAIIEALDEEQEERHLEDIYKVLSRFNNTIKTLDEALGGGFDTKDWEQYEERLHDMYLNILLQNLNGLFLRFGKIGFHKRFSEIYWEHTQRFILELWMEMPGTKSVAANESSFMKIFEDFFSQTIKAFPDFIIKPLKEFHNLYRASRHEVFDNYKYIMPDPKYCKDNRWNDDGVAFLYLSYDNDGRKCQNLELAQKTCFEEIRAREGDRLSVCKFKALHRRVKILDLSFDGIDFDEQLMELERSKDDYEERIKLLIKDNSKVKNKLEMYAKSDDMEGFKKELSRIEKKLGIDSKMNSKIQLQLSKILIGNICDSIFYAVDKEDDPALEAYVPFRVFSKYLINKGLGGVAYRSTRMELAGLKGKCLTLFNPEDAIYVQGEMEVYEYHKEGCTFLKKY